MKIKNKGRKIYKTKEKNYYGKSPIGKFFSALLTVVLIGGIGFLGYSVAGPRINYSRKQGDEEIQKTSSYEEKNSGVSEITENDSLKTEEIDSYRSIRLNEYEIMNYEAIKTAISRIPQEQNIEYVEVPLKLPNGKLMYDTSYEDIEEIKDSDLELKKIVTTIKKEGYIPVAYVSVFSDNIIPKEYPQYGYLDNETISAWCDSDSQIWASPFSDDYLNYIDFIVEEISKADFQKIICADIQFPEFSNRDLNILNNSKLEDSNRYTALINVENMLYKTISENNSDMFLEISASDILCEKSEILKSASLNSDTIVIDINLDEISNGVDTGSTVYEFNDTPSENIIKMLNLIKEKTLDFNIIIRISGNNYNTSEILRAKDDMAEMGYISFILG